MSSMYLMSVPPLGKSNGGCLNRPAAVKYSGMPTDTAKAVETLYRADWGRIVATLIRLIGDFDLAEECAQEAFAAAVDQWEASGVPDAPRAWIIQTARHKAIDRIRRQGRYQEKLASYAQSGFVRDVTEPDDDA